MNNELQDYKEKTFDDIKHIDEIGNEYWEARELMPLLEYSKWENFHKVIKKAMIACETSNNNVNDHFPEFRKPIVGGKGNIQNVVDYHLSRYACYLIVQNANPRKKSVALGQTYFAIQTRRQELLDDEIKSLNEDEKRLKLRGQIKDGNKNLNDTVYQIGARTNKEFAKFHNEGYKGLYGGETMKRIQKRKGLNENENILDHMGSTESAANWFRITQTDEMLKNNNIDTLDLANKTHNKVGKEVRKTMIRLSGVAPENLPTPNKSIKQIEKEEKERLISKDKQIQLPL